MSNTIPTSIRKPGFYGQYDSSLANQGQVPLNDQKLLIIGQRLATYIETGRFQGDAGNLDDITTGGTFAGDTITKFIVRIAATGTPDTMEYSTDDGATFSSAVSITGGAITLEAGVTVTFGATTGHTALDTWEFTAWPEPTEIEAAISRILTSDEAAVFWGYGSMMHIMADASFSANKRVELYGISLDDAGAGVAASGGIDFNGTTATKAGVVTLWVGNQKVEIAFSLGDALADISAALNEEIAATTMLPLTSVQESYQGDPIQDELTFTAKNKGVIGNQIDLEITITDGTGITATITAMNSGATDPDIQTALDEVFSTRYHFIANPWNDQTSMIALRTHLDSAGDEVEQRGAFAFTGIDASLASTTALATIINNERMGLVSLFGTKSLPYELACGVAAVHELNEDVALPLDNVEILGIGLPEITDRFSRTSVEIMLAGGVFPLEVTTSNQVVITRAISTYLTNDQAVADTAFLEVNTIRSLDFVRDTMRAMFLNLFVGKKKSSGINDRIKSEVENELRKLAAPGVEVVKDVDTWIPLITVEDNSTDVNRVDVDIPAPIVPGLHIIASKFFLILT